MRNYSSLQLWLLGLWSVLGYGQETLDTYNPNNYTNGGDKKYTTAQISLQPIALIDVEPDMDNTVNFGIPEGGMEAGLPVSFNSVFEEATNNRLWLNFTYRAINNSNASIIVRTNQPVPKHIKIDVEIINTSDTGDFPKNPRRNKFKIDEKSQTIVWDFGNGYTGDGVNNGYQLEYTLHNKKGKSLPQDFRIIYEIITDKNGKKNKH
ncbi:hypothetical protein SAMN04487911_1449 [Arenibacter nanhaiticus]|uniref:Uncharacterized protein n=1 Tax=Arenibacter nanhaiticus TaxID=558155 RepID=A0A1M6MLR8_9FLAO|nr:hypothetical protein [Arenibacter nanhaiticus]SHJ84431.1 hypothetical protein SAMN04487911_1449 [Arenibacter nanhaiticus]